MIWVSTLKPEEEKESRTKFNILYTTMASLLNNYVFQLAWYLTSSGTSVKITNDLERNQVVVFQNAYVTIKSWKKIERVKANAAAGTLTLLKRWLDQLDVDTEVTLLKKDWREWTTCYVTIMASQLQWIINLTLSWGFQPPQMTTTQRDALTPSQGLLIANTTTWTNQMYQGWSWLNIWTSTTPFASTTVAWTKQDPSDAQVIAGTDTWSTWATMSVLPSQFKKSISLKPLVTVTAPSTDKIAIAYSDWTDKSILLSDFVNQVPANTTSRWFVQMATDTEATVGTDQTKFVNAKQVKDNTVYNWALTINSVSNPWSTATTVTWTSFQITNRTVCSITISAGTLTTSTLQISNDWTTWSTLYQVANSWASISMVFMMKPLCFYRWVVTTAWSWAWVSWGITLTYTV